MAKNKRLLINNLGESHEAFALDGSSASENKFVWRQNVKKIEKLQLKEERQVHKSNALKSRYSKIDFIEWKKYVLRAKKNVTKVDLKVREMLYGKGVITLSTYIGQIQEEYSNKNFEKKQKFFIKNANELVEKIEKKQRIVTEARFIKHKDVPETTTKQELVKNARLEVLEVIERLSTVIEKFALESVYETDEKSVDFEGTSKREIYIELLEEYKNKRPKFVVEAKEKAKSFIAPFKVGNPMFDFHARVRKNVFKLELAKLEHDFLKDLSKYDWEYKFKFELAKEYINTLPNIISEKQITSKKLLNARNQLRGLKESKISEKRFINTQIREESREARENAKLKIKEELNKLKLLKITKDDFKTKKLEIKNNLKLELKTIRLKNEIFATKEKLKETRKNAKLKIKEESNRLKLSEITKDDFKTKKIEIENDLKLELKTIKLNSNVFAIKEKLNEAKINARLKIKEESARLKMSGAARNGLKVKKAEIKHNLKAKARSIKLEDKIFTAHAEYKFLLADLSQKIKYQSKILESNLQEIRKKTPVEITKSKYWSSIVAGSIFPGLGSLINRQWTKGIMQILGTIFFIIILAWCFGAFPSSTGNGIIGLGTFGAVDGHLVNNNDSRFYLVMGTIGIIFLLAAFMYWIISALNIINVANLSRAGVRYSNWKDQKRLLKTAGLPYLLSAPALIFILFIVVLPLLATLLLSFTNFNQRVVDPNNPGKHIVLNGVRYPFYWVGGQQFTYITRVVGSDFVNVLQWTVLWTIFATFLTMFLGTLLAILVNQNRIKGKTFFRIIYILPWAIPAFLTILFFSIFFGKDGTFNHVIGEKMFGRAINWKIEVNHEKALLIFIQGWLGQSYMFLLVTGMLQSIPKSLYEAARVDGSKPLQQFRTITMPIIVMQIAPLLIGQFTFNFNNFGIIYLFNNGGPVLPGHSAGETDIFLSWVFRMVNDGVFAKPGAGAALSLLVSIFVVTPSAFLFFRSKSFRGGNF